MNTRTCTHTYTCNIVPIYCFHGFLYNNIIITAQMYNHKCMDGLHNLPFLESQTNRDDLFYVAESHQIQQIERLGDC